MNAAGKTVSAVCRHRLAAAIAFAAFAIAAAAAISRANFDSDIYDLLPKSDSAIAAHVRAAKDFGQSNTLFFNVSGDRAEEACDALAAALKKDAEIKSVVGAAEDFDFDESLKNILQLLPRTFTEADSAELEKKTSPAELRKRAADFKRNIASPQHFGAARVFAKDPAGALAAVAEKLKRASGGLGEFGFSGGRISDKQRKNFLVMAEGNFDSSDSAKSAELAARIETLNADIERRFGAKVAYAGGYRVAAENARIAAKDSSLCLAATVATVAAICLAAFARKAFAALAVLPSLVGTAAAFCAVQPVFGRVSTIAVGFASVAVGVGIDYALHALYGLDGREKISDADAAQSASDNAKPVAVAAGTSALAFVIIGFSGSGGFAQIGLFGTVGIIVSALASVLVLPAFAPLAKTRGRLKIGFAPTDFPPAKKLRAAAAVLLSAAAVPFALDVKFDGNLASLSALGKEAKRDDTLLRSVWKDGVSRAFLLVEADSSDAAKRKCAEIERRASELPNAEIFPLSPILPDSKTRAENAARWEKFRDGKAAQIEAAARADGLNPSALDLDIWRGKVSPEPEKLRPLADIFRGKISPDGRAIALPVKLADGADRRKFAEAAERLGAHYIDAQYLGERIAQNAYEWLAKFAAAAFAAVALYLLAATRSVSAALKILAPVAVGLLWSLGIMGAAGIPINMVNSVFVIFAVCIAQDYAVFPLFAKMRGRKPPYPAVFLSAATTVAAFGMLGFAEHPVMKTLGLAAAVSIFAIFCACLALSPERGNGK